MADRYHHGDLRRQLLDEAGVVLEEDGPEALTLRGLARRLGVSHAAPGHHFADRGALLVELAAQGHRDLEQAMRDRLASDPGEEPAVAIGEGYLDFALEHPQRFRLMFAGVADLSPSDSPSFSEAAGASFATLVRTTTGTADPDADPTRWMAAWALVHGLATLWVDGSLPGDRSDTATFRARATRILRDHSAGG